MYIKDVAYIYSCNDCDKKDRVEKEHARDGQRCSHCGGHAHIIGVFDSEGQAKFLRSVSDKERIEIIDNFDKHMNTLKEINTLHDKQSMRDRVYRLEEQIATLTEDVESQQERVKTLNDTNSKSEMLFLTLLETKPQAIKTLETLAETIETTEKELVTRYTSFARKKTKMIKLLVERNKLLLELNDEEK